MSDYEDAKKIFAILQKNVSETIDKEIIPDFEYNNENIMSLSLSLITIGLSLIPASSNAERTLQSIDFLISKYMPNWKGNSELKKELSNAITQNTTTPSKKLLN